MNSIIQLHYKYSEYCLTFKGHSPKSLRTAFYNIKQFVEANQIDSIHKINRQMIEQYIMKRRVERNWSPATIKNNILNLHTFLEYCFKEGLILENPAKGIPMPKQRKALPKALEKEDAMRVLEWTYTAKFTFEYVRIRDRAMLAMFLFTGVRKSELLDLKISDIRITEKILRVECGKGGKDRIIPMNDSLIHILNLYLEIRKKNNKTTMYFFTSLRGNKKMSYISIRRLFDRLKKDLQMRVYPHKLRHTFATLMLQGNCDLYSLSNMLGHSDIKTTTIYLGLTTGHLKDQINKHPLGIKEVLPHRRFL